MSYKYHQRNATKRKHACIYACILSARDELKIIFQMEMNRRVLPEGQNLLEMFSGYIKPPTSLRNNSTFPGVQ